LIKKKKFIALISQSSSVESHKFQNITWGFKFVAKEENGTLQILRLNAYMCT
jgi:hypothetical protein